MRGHGHQLRIIREGVYWNTCQMIFVQIIFREIRATMCHNHAWSACKVGIHEQTHDDPRCHKRYGGWGNLCIQRKFSYNAEYPSLTDTLRRTGTLFPILPPHYELKMEERYYVNVTLHATNCIMTRCCDVYATTHRSRND